MTEQDPVMARIAEGIRLGQRGRPGEARDLFSAIWDEIGAGGDPLHRCMLAHSMADVCDEVPDELAWDELALRAAGSITDDRVRQAGMPVPARALYPSLHLNLAEAHRKLGRLDSAREHLGRGRATLGALPDDGYGQMIREGLDRLAGRLDTT